MINFEIYLSFRFIVIRYGTLYLHGIVGKWRNIMVGLVNGMFLSKKKKFVKSILRWCHYLAVLSLTCLRNHFDILNQAIRLFLYIQMKFRRLRFFTKEHDKYQNSKADFFFWFYYLWWGSEETTSWVLHSFQYIGISIRLWFSLCVRNVTWIFEWKVLVMGD